MTTSTADPVAAPAAWPASGAVVGGPANPLTGVPTYRWGLWRRWGPDAPMVWVMLNPSTADDDDDDPTIRRCIGFAKREGCGGIDVFNLWPYRAKDPADLFGATNPTGPGVPWQPLMVSLVGHPGATLVVGWGAHRARAERIHGPSPVRLWLEDFCPDRALCLGLTASGDPRHPLMVRADEPLIPWKDRPW